MYSIALFRLLALGEPMLPSPHPGPLSGSFGMDKGLVLVFAPCDEEELQLVLEIMNAGV